MKARDVLGGVVSGTINKKEINGKKERGGIQGYVHVIGRDIGICICNREGHMYIYM